MNVALSRPGKERLLEDLTIVILTYNRQRELRRVIGFWSKLEVHVLVIDGSDSAETFDVFALPERIRYVHSPSSYQDRMRQATSLVATRYVAQVPDDELFVPSALEQCIAFLNSNKDFLACCGAVLAIALDRVGPYWTVRYPNLRAFETIKADDMGRFASHMSHYRPVNYYSVFRRNEWSMLWMSVLNFNFSPIASNELLFEAGASFLGRTKVIDSVMWVRNGIVPSHHDSANPTLPVTSRFSVWWVAEEFREETYRFVRAVEKIFSEVRPPISTRDSWRAERITEAFDAYSNSVRSSQPRSLPEAYLVAAWRKFLGLWSRLVFWRKKKVRAIEEISKIVGNDIQYDSGALAEIEIVLAGDLANSPPTANS